MFRLTFKFTTLLALSLFAGTTFAQLPMDLHDVEVELVADMVANKIHVKSAGDQCPTGEMGCFTVAKNAYLRLKFEIPAPASNKWFLRRIGVCKGTTPTYPPCGPLKKWERAEFIATKPGADALLHPNENGVIDLPGKSSKVNLYSMNNIPQSWSYSIQACKKDNPSDCTDLDPIIKNGGRK